MSSFKDIYFYNNTAGSIILEQGLTIPTNTYVKLNDYYNLEDVVRSGLIKTLLETEDGYLSFDGSNPLNRQQSLRALSNALQLNVTEPVFILNNVDLTTLGETLVGTCPQTLEFVISRVLITMDTATSVTREVRISVGTSDPYQDLVYPTILTQFTTAGQAWVQKILGVTKKISAGDQIYFNVDRAMLATAATASVYVYGYGV